VEGAGFAIALFIGNAKRPTINLERENMKRNKRGFTIVEVLVVIILISLIASVIVPKIIPSIDEQKIKLTKVKMASLKAIIQQFYLDCGQYPDDSEDLESLIICPSGLEDKWKGAYLTSSGLLDAWENPFLYAANDNINPGNFVLISYGADGVPGGEGVNADIDGN